MAGLALKDGDSFFHAFAGLNGRFLVPAGLLPENPHPLLGVFFYLLLQSLTHDPGYDKRIAGSLGWKEAEGDPCIPVFISNRPTENDWYAQPAGELRRPKGDLHSLAQEGNQNPLAVARTVHHAAEDPTAAQPAVGRHGRTGSSPQQGANRIFLTKIDDMSF